MKVLCQGVPPDTVFPLQSLSVTLADGTAVSLNADEVRLAQRYAPFAWGPLRQWALDHVRSMHAPPMPDWDIAIAAGSMSSIDLVSAAFLDRGDVVLIEEYSFMASLDAFLSYGVKLVPVALDAEGMQPEALEAACASLAADGRRAKLLYAVPVGQNPTGSTLCRRRYEEIYEIARRYEILIVEDDAYFYLQHSLREPDADSTSRVEGSRELPGLRLGPTFLSLDVDGRVLRLDSFSKFLAPGFRIGWVSGARALTSKYNSLAYASSQNGSSMSMMLLGKMLEAWGTAGFEAHLCKLQAALRDRCDAMLAAVEEHLGGRAEWHRPQAGMFLWVRLLKPAADKEQLMALMREHSVAVFPGENCSAAASTGLGTEICPYIRLSFVLPDDQYPEAIRRVGALVQALL